MTTKPARLEMAFPEVGLVRKGAKKGANRPGADLESKLRLDFHPGCEEYEGLFKKAFEKDGAYLGEYPLVTKIRAMVPFQSVWSAWQSYNEAYQNGRLILRADDQRVLFYKNPVTGKTLVRDGKLEAGVKPSEAPTEYTPKMVIRYEGRDGVKELPTRLVSRLRLFLPEMGRMVSMTLKTTSYYDSLNLAQNLGAIEAAAWLNRGVAGGIPFYVFRRKQQIIWNKPDGGCLPVSKWLLYLEIDPAWVEAATRRMADHSLTGSNLAGLLAAPVEEVRGEVDPEDEDEGDEVEGEYAVEERASSGNKDPLPSNKEPSSQAGEGRKEEEKSHGKVSRPLQGETLREMLRRKAQLYEGKEPSENQKGLAASMLTKCFAGEKNAEESRRMTQRFLLGVGSMKEASGGQVLALLDWLKPAKDSGGDWQPDVMAVKEAGYAYRAAQKEMPLF